MAHYPDILTEWFSVAVIQDASSEETSSNIYRSWEAWAAQNHRRKQSHKAVSQALARGGYQKRRTSLGIVFVGIRIRNP